MRRSISRAEAQAARFSAIALAAGLRHLRASQAAIGGLQVDAIDGRAARLFVEAGDLASRAEGLEEELAAIGRAPVRRQAVSA